ALASCWLQQGEGGSLRAVGQSSGTSGPSAPKPRLQQNYAKLPLSFEANVGQTDTAVQFLARGSGYGLYLTGTEAVMVLKPAADVRPAVLHMQLLDGNPAPQGIGHDALPGKVHYFRGNDPARWRTNVTTFGRVEYANIYPGIDLVYYGNPAQLEYDFVVAPGADPQAIHLAFTGADQVSLDEYGDLVLAVGKQKIRWRKPVAYQEVNGSRQEVAATFVVRDETIGFDVASYDASRRLVIDPVLSYATYLGGSGNDD